MGGIHSSGSKVDVGGNLSIYVNSNKVYNNCVTNYCQEGVPRQACGVAPVTDQCAKKESSYWIVRTAYRIFSPSQNVEVNSTEENQPYDEDDTSANEDILTTAQGNQLNIKGDFSVETRSYIVVNNCISNTFPEKDSKEMSDNGPLIQDVSEEDGSGSVASKQGGPNSTYISDTD